MSKERQRAAYSTLGADVKEAQQSMKMSRRELAEMANIDTRYLANIEKSGLITSLPLLCEIVSIVKIPMAKYFNQVQGEDVSEQRKRIDIKLALCPEKYLPFVESTLDNAIQINREEAEHE